METTTRDNLIASTQKLMLQQGYSGTGILDICKDAGVSKGAFYHSFASKEEVAVIALNDFYRAGLTELMAIDVSHEPPAERMIAFVDAVAGQSELLWGQGCLVGSLANEMAMASDTLHQHVSAIFTEMAGIISVLARPFAASLAEGEVTADQLGEHFLIVVEGAVVMARAHRDPSRISAALRRYARFLRALPRHT